MTATDGALARAQARAQAAANGRRLRMPAEWAPRAGTLISWPVAESLVHPRNHRPLCHAYAEVANAIAAYEPLTMIVNPEDSRAAEWLLDGQIERIELPHDDAWMRDNGPSIVHDLDAPAGQEDRVAISWRFNGWGGKYGAFDRDDAVAPALARHLGLDCIEVPMVLEGGAIHVDGEGTLLTTGECLLHPNRNPGWTREAIEATLLPLLGCTRALWLPCGLDGDETDGHIDNVACFSAPGRLLLQSCDDTSDPNFLRTAANREAIRRWTEETGIELELIEIPQPPLRRYQDGSRLALSYINYYLVDGAAIVPTFGGDAKAADERALAILAEQLPGRDIVPIDGSVLITEGGNVHCITQQIPARRR